MPLSCNELVCELENNKNKKVSLVRKDKRLFTWFFTVQFKCLNQSTVKLVFIIHYFFFDFIF